MRINRPTAVFWAARTPPLIPNEPIGRRRAVPPANDTDPYQHCNPMGPSRALIYPDPMEMIVLPDRTLQQFEWGYGLRTIWTDGRQPLMDPDLPRWWGYSAARWDGDTFVVTTTGVDERTWIDHYGYPHSVDMVLGGALSPHGLRCARADR